MRNVNDVFECLKDIAPLELQLGFDNAGFQLGRLNAPVERVLLALDVTSEVVDEAERLGAQLIVSHHPLIFSPIKCVSDEFILRLAEHSIAVISMHTNLDIAEGGVNDVLLELLGAKRESYLDADNCGRVGVLTEEMELPEFLAQCKRVLNVGGLKYHDAHRPVRHIAVMGGSGGDYVGDAFEKGCDTYLTADIKHHQFLLAKELGINLIDADHFCTENPVISVLAARLTEVLPDIDFRVSEVHACPASFA